MSAVIFANENIVVREAGKEELEKLSASAEFAGLVGEDCTVCSVSATNGELYGAIARRRYTQWQMEGIICFTLPEHRRSGYAAQAVRGFTRWFYDNTTENMLIAVVDLENVPAVRTLERAGYEYIRTTTLASESEGKKGVYHLFVCSRAVADAGAPPRGCCCGCGGHAQED